LTSVVGVVVGGGGGCSSRVRVFTNGGELWEMSGDGSALPLWLVSWHPVVFHPRKMSRSVVGQPDTTLSWSSSHTG